MKPEDFGVAESTQYHSTKSPEFFKTRDREGIMRTVREVVHRVPLDEREVKLLRAMAIELGKFGERLARSGLHLDRE